MPSDRVYTHATWRVRQGRESDFVEAWLELGRVFGALPAPPIERGTLIRSEADPRLFHSFGPWRSAADVAAMRAHPGAIRAMDRVRANCEDATPGLYRIVAEVELPGPQAGR